MVRALREYNSDYIFDKSTDFLRAHLVLSRMSAFISKIQICFQDGSLVFVEDAKFLCCEKKHRLLNKDKIIYLVYWLGLRVVLRYRGRYIRCATGKDVVADLLYRARPEKYNSSP